MNFIFEDMIFTGTDGLVLRIGKIRTLVGEGRDRASIIVGRSRVSHGTWPSGEIDHQKSVIRDCQFDPPSLFQPLDLYIAIQSRSTSVDLRTYPI